MRIYELPNLNRAKSQEEIRLNEERMRTFILSGFSLEQTQCKKLRRSSTAS